MIWKESYKIGVDLIDGQHEELFQRVTSFVETLRAPVPWEEKVDQVNRTLDFMQEYVITHFHDEELYQAKIGYPNMAKHIKIHHDMVQYVADVANQFQRDGYHEPLIQQFAGKLLAWLIHHVTYEDHKIADFVQGKKVTGNE